jgi:acyl phosphate:glycerol-3-phosphate acyltransferase
MALLAFVLCIAASYLLGAIPFGLIIVKIGTGKDVRGIGSGRTGGTNAMRAAGVLAGVLTAVFDVLKGAATFFLVIFAGPIAKLSEPGIAWLQVVCGLAAIIGHNYSIFLIHRDESGMLKLAGGAWGATCLGGAIAIWPPIVWFIVGLAILVYIVVGFASVTTMSIALIAICVFIYRAAMGYSSWIYVVYGVLAELLLVWALRPNIKRLIEGKERSVGIRSYIQRRKAGKRPDFYNGDDLD